MITQDERIRILQKAQLQQLPEASNWTRDRWPAGSPPARADEYRIKVSSPARPGKQHLMIVLRHDGDI